MSNEDKIGKNEISLNNEQPLLRGKTQFLDVPLVPEEVLNAQFELGYSISLPFLKNVYWVTNKRLIVKFPQFFLIFPVGSDHLTYPLKNIGGIKLSKRTSLARFIFGASLTYLSFSFWQYTIQGGFLGLGLGLYFLMTAFQDMIVITSSGTGTISHNVLPWEKKVASEIVNYLNAKVASLN